MLDDNNGAIELTVAEYQSPNGHRIALGIEPDVVFTESDSDRFSREHVQRDTMLDPSVLYARDILFGALLHQSGLGLGTQAPPSR